MSLSHAADAGRFVSSLSVNYLVEEKSARDPCGRAARFLSSSRPEGAFNGLRQQFC